MAAASIEPYIPQIACYVNGSVKTCSVGARDVSDEKRYVTLIFRRSDMELNSGEHSGFIIISLMAN